MKCKRPLEVGERRGEKTVKGGIVGMQRRRWYEIRPVTGGRRVVETAQHRSHNGNGNPVKHLIRGVCTVQEQKDVTKIVCTQSLMSQQATQSK